MDLELKYYFDVFYKKEINSCKGIKILKRFYKSDLILALMCL